MAHVEVQSVSERHAARRTFPLLARTKTCRNLFGPVDHEELGREMKQKLQEISEADRSRWNFNFELHAPLPGNYEWEEVGTSCVPAFYRDSARCGARTLQKKELENPTEEVNLENQSGELNQENESGELNQENESGELNQENWSRALNGTRARKLRRNRSVPESARTNSTHITDFFPRRKRTAESKSESSSRPVEMTPRKRIRW